MLNPSRKIATKEVEVSTYAKATSFYYENKKYVSYGVVAFIVLFVGTVIFMNNRRASDENASAELGKVFSIYDAGATDPSQYKIAIEGQPGRGIMGLKAIVEKFGGSESG